MAVAYLGLGSNLGDRLRLLRSATAALPGHALSIVARSPVFETDAVADEVQPPYLNAALRIETALSPRALLEHCLAIEAALGRVRTEGQRAAPRTVDVDLLLYGDEIIDEPGLVVPHPRLLERAFVRVPLALVAAAGLRHPLTAEPLDAFDQPPDVRWFASPL